MAGITKLYSFFFCGFVESAIGLQEISCILTILTEKQVLRMPLMRGKEWLTYSDYRLKI